MQNYLVLIKKECNARHIISEKEIIEPIIWHNSNTYVVDLTNFPLNIEILYALLCFISKKEIIEPII